MIKRLLLGFVLSIVLFNVSPAFAQEDSRLSLVNSPNGCCPAGYSTNPKGCPNTSTLYGGNQTCSKRIGTWVLDVPAPFGLGSCSFANFISCQTKSADETTNAGGDYKLNKDSGLQQVVSESQKWIQLKCGGEQDERGCTKATEPCIEKGKTEYQDTYKAYDVDWQTQVSNIFTQGQFPMGEDTIASKAKQAGVGLARECINKNNEDFKRDFVSRLANTTNKPTTAMAYALQNQAKNNQTQTPIQAIPVTLTQPVTGGSRGNTQGSPASPQTTTPKPKKTYINIKIEGNAVKLQNGEWVLVNPDASFTITPQISVEGETEECSKNIPTLGFNVLDTAEALYPNCTAKTIALSEEQQNNISTISVIATYEGETETATIKVPHTVKPKSTPAPTASLTSDPPVSEGRTPPETRQMTVTAFSNRIENPQFTVNDQLQGQSECIGGNIGGEEKCIYKLVIDIQQGNYEIRFPNAKEPLIFTASDNVTVSALSQSTTPQAELEKVLNFMSFGIGDQQFTISPGGSRSVTVISKVSYPVKMHYTDGTEDDNYQMITIIYEPEGGVQPPVASSEPATQPEQQTESQPEQQTTPPVIEESARECNEGQEECRGDQSWFCSGGRWTIDEQETNNGDCRPLWRCEGDSFRKFDPNADGSSVNPTGEVTECPNGCHAIQTGGYREDAECN